MTQHSGVGMLPKMDISDMESELIVDGLVVVKPYSYYQSLDEYKIKNFLVKWGIYVLPTQELVDWLKDNIVGTAIEIGAGVGTLGRALNIPITDNRMQEWPLIKAIYQTMGQNPIVYPPDVETLDYKQAILKYKPQTVIGGFITHKWEPGMQSGNEHGPREEFILANSEKYIMIGNLATHGAKPILKRKHQQLYFDWLITRGLDQSKNRIFVWEQ